MQLQGAMTDYDSAEEVDGVTVFVDTRPVEPLSNKYGFIFPRTDGGYSKVPFFTIPSRRELTHVELYERIDPDMTILDTFGLPLDKESSMPVPFGIYYGANLKEDTVLKNTNGAPVLGLNSHYITVRRNFLDAAQNALIKASTAKKNVLVNGRLYSAQSLKINTISSSKFYVDASGPVLPGLFNYTVELAFVPIEETPVSYYFISVADELNARKAPIAQVFTDTELNTAQLCSHVSEKLSVVDAKGVVLPKHSTYYLVPFGHYYVVNLHTDKLLIGPAPLLFKVAFNSYKGRQNFLNAADSSFLMSRNPQNLKRDYQVVDIQSTDGSEVDLYGSPKGGGIYTYTLGPRTNWPEYIQTSDGGRRRRRTPRRF